MALPPAENLPLEMALGKSYQQMRRQVVTMAAGISLKSDSGGVRQAEPERLLPERLLPERLTRAQVR